MPTTANDWKVWVERQASGDLSDRVHRRHVCSRAYYAAFHRLRALALELLPGNFHIRLGVYGAHQFLGGLFHDKCPVAGESGEALTRLRTTRHECDYDLHKTSPTTIDVRDAVERMQQVFNEVAALNEAKRNALRTALIERAQKQPFR